MMPGLRQLFTKSDDLEKSQAIVRLVFNSAALVWIGFRGPEQHGNYPAIMTWLSIAFLFSVGTLVNIVCVPAWRNYRLRVTVFVDALMVTSLFYLGGIYATPLLFMYFTMPLGNGLRFGFRQFLTSLACTSVGLIIGLLAIETTGESRAFTYGVATAFIVVNIAAGSVVRRLEDMKNMYARMAMHDVLTGLPNRRFFKARFDKMISESRRTGNGVGCFFIDLDGFKAVNDQWGHFVGDKLIVAVGNVLRDAIRNVDIASRISGDEFVVAAICNDDDASIRVLADRILKRIESIGSVGKCAVKVSASIGVAYFNPTTENGRGFDAETLMHSADAAMYESKRSGKGKTTISERL